MRTAAFVLGALSFVLQVFIMWRAGQAASHRDEQSADSNDVVLVTALATMALVLATLSATCAVLSL